MSQDAQHQNGLFNQNIRIFFRDALRITLRDPSVALFVLKTIWRQRRAMVRRARWEERGVHVIPFIMASVTNRCNLRCTGCYACENIDDRGGDAEMDPGQLRSFVAQADEIGVSIILIAGGEPLVRSDLLDITGDHPGVIFPLFTNGLLIDDAVIRRLRRQRNVVPVLSLEGRRAATDGRRGAGVYEQVLDRMQRMREAGIFFGTSLMLTRDNVDRLLDESFIRDLFELGCRIFFFVNFVPVEPGTDQLALTPEQKRRKAEILTDYRQRLPGLFMDFPGDEQRYGGCLAAGRGFVHISPEGHVEPCPFSPFSDSSLKDIPLIEALQSDFLRKIRESGVQELEPESGCVLWDNRQWLTSLLEPEPVGDPEEMSVFGAIGERS